MQIEAKSASATFAVIRARKVIEAHVRFWLIEFLKLFSAQQTRLTGLVPTHEEARKSKKGSQARGDLHDRSDAQPEIS